MGGIEQNSDALTNGHFLREKFSMTQDKPFVSVIIPTYHDWDRLKKCIEALKIQTYPSDLFEVIIVNNDPADKAPSLDFLKTLSSLVRRNLVLTQRETQL